MQKENDVSSEEEETTHIIEKIEGVKKEPENKKDAEDTEDTDDNEDGDDDYDEDEDGDDDEDGNLLTDQALFNILGNYFTNEEGKNIADILTDLSQEFAKLNHTIKKKYKDSK